jgi:hypothetical protein
MTSAQPVVHVVFHFCSERHKDIAYAYCYVIENLSVLLEMALRPGIDSEFPQLGLQNDVCWFSGLAASDAIKIYCATESSQYCKARLA